MAKVFLDQTFPNATFSIFWTHLAVHFAFWDFIATSRQDIFSTKGLKNIVYCDKRTMTEHFTQPDNMRNLLLEAAKTSA